MNTSPHPLQADQAPAAPPPDFSCLACVYRWLEWATFGPYLGKCRYAFLSEALACRRALVIGDGDGRFTARLLAVNAQIQVEAIDASPAMLRALVHRASANAARVHPQIADARTWQPSGPQYDLIVTHFFLDCLTTQEIQSLVAHLRKSSSPSSQWLVSEFAIPDGRLARPIACLLIRALYLGFGWLTGLRIRALPDHREALLRAGFHCYHHRAWLGGLLIGELWSPTPPDSARASGPQPKSRV